MPMAKFIFDGINKLFIARSGITSIDVQVDLYSDWKEVLRESDNMKYEQALSTIGGDDLTAGRTLGDTYFLENGWKLRPYEGEDHVLNIDGNLFSRDGSGAVVPTTGNTNVLVEMFVSNLVDSTVAQLDITNLQYLIESQRIATTRGYGTIYYVDTINGLDSNNGLSPENAYKTINNAVSNVTDGQGDVIFVLNKGIGELIINEDIILNKENMSIRGPGAAIRLCNQSDNHTILCSSKDVSVEGFIIESTGTNSGTVVVQDDYFTLENCIVPTGGNDLISIQGGQHHIIRDCYFHDSRSHAIHLETLLSDITEVSIERCKIYDNDIGVHLNGTGCICDISLLTNEIYNNGTGIWIENPNLKDCNIHSDNLLVDNFIGIYNEVSGEINNELELEPRRFISELKSSYWDHSSGTGSGNFQDSFMEILAMAKGRIVNSSSGVFDFYDLDDTNVIFTLVESGTQRLLQ